MARKSTIGANPLDAVVPIKSGRTKQAGVQAEPARPVKERVTFQLPAPIIERARDAVYWTPGLTMAALMEEALRTHLDGVEKKRGEPIPSRKGAALKTGRPVKAA
jgi:hypothetical protein